MATLPIAEGLIPPEEYLSRCYEPDCEYVDGLIVERAVGEFEHSFVQALLATLFNSNTESWGVYALTEQRIRLSPHCYRIPDVCVLRRGALREPILIHPPLLAVEILSPGDSLSRILKKCAEYHQFGIAHLWVIDPAERSLFHFTESGLTIQLDGVLSVSGTPISIDIQEIFARMDRL
jgi:Uma2 family endonuclease